MKLELDFKKENGLIPVIIQDYQTLKILMLGFMNQEAFEKTIETKKVWFYSRSRKQLWQKGETSGNFVIVKKIFTDCDTDSLLVLAQQIGKATCHTGRESCFFYESDLKENWKEID